MVRTDQIGYGLLALDLYADTQDARYKDFADQYFNLLDGMDREEGLLLYRQGSGEQHVDAIGLVTPFLYAYSEAFHNERAKEIADKMIADYVRWGTDDVTGIPVQTYNVKTHVKYNHTNWGRGISWYLLGVEHFETQDSLLNRRIALLDSMLLADEDHLYNQYFEQGTMPDMSATIPVLHYLRQKGLLKLTKDEFAAKVSPYFDAEGILRYASPSITSPHKGVSEFITSLCFQGLSLYEMGEME